MAGRKAKVEPLVLITGDDFEWYYEWRTAPDGPAANWPAGYQVYFEFQNGTGGAWTGGTKWSFVIAGSLASLKIESEVADIIPARTPYRLVLKMTGTTPTTEKVLALGNVERQEPRA